MSAAEGAQAGGEGSPARVLLIGPLPPTKLAEADMTIHLALRLAARNLDVHVLTGRDSLGPPAGPFTVHAAMRTWAWTDLPRLAGVLRRYSPDAVLLVYLSLFYRYHPMATFIPTVCKRLRPRTRVVTLFEEASSAEPHHHHLATRAIRKVVAMWAGPAGVDYGFGTLLRDSDRVIVVSDRIRRPLVRRWPGVQDKSVVIPTPAIMPMASEGREAARRATRAALGLQVEDVLLVFVGYLYPGKGVETLLEALSQVRPLGRRLHLLVVGGTLTVLDSPAYAAGLRATATRLGVAAQVTWTGDYPWNSQLPSRALSAADLCVLPFDSGIDLQHSSFAAAAVHGCPIITTQGDAGDGFFRHGTNVYLCPPKNPPALATAIETLLADGSLRGRLSAGAEAVAAEWYDWDRVVDRILVAITG